jgi:hypothetical protein
LSRPVHALAKERKRLPSFTWRRLRSRHYLAGRTSPALHASVATTPKPPHTWPAQLHDSPEQGIVACVDACADARQGAGPGREARAVQLLHVLVARPPVRTVRC